MKIVSKLFFIKRTSKLSIQVALSNFFNSRSINPFDNINNGTIIKDTRVYQNSYVEVD